MKASTSLSPFLFRRRLIESHRLALSQQIHNGSERRQLSGASSSGRQQPQYDANSASGAADSQSKYYVAETFPQNVDWGRCIPLHESQTNVTTMDEFQNFEFQPEWMKSKEYWDQDMEQRHSRQQIDPKRPPLKVIIVPHSHNDPGWLKTFVGYFQADTRQILNNVITRMNKQYTDMTFIWTEISFLQMWWDQAHPTKQRVSTNLT